MGDVAVSEFALTSAPRYALGDVGVSTMSAYPSPASKVMCFAATAALAASLAGWLTRPLAAAPVSKCRLNNQSEYLSPADRTITDERRKEARLRVLIDALDDVDIVFRGRLISRRYLSDVSQTFVPLILEVYGSAVMLKGDIPSAAKDGQVFLLREKLCNGGCALNTLPEVVDDKDGRERVILALKNTLENPGEARDRWSNKAVYSGRIDALLGPCDPHQVNESSALALITSPDEMERLKRAYPHRTAEEKRADFLEIQKKWFGQH
jgi:hypothetical protein